jgi:membrane fusion protein (multidrug efflux system)
MLKRISLLVVIIIVVAAIIWAVEHFSVTAPAVAQKPAPTVVTVAIAKSENWPKELATTGTISSIKGIMVDAETAGRVTKVFIKSGQVVKQGQPLFQINPAIRSADLQAIKAKLKLQRVNMEQQEKLFAKGFGSKIILDRAKSLYQSTKEQVQSAEAKLDLSLVRAPIAGKLGLHLVKRGDVVEVNQPLISLETNSALRVDFSVPAIYLNDLKIGQHATVFASAFPKEPLVATVYAINARVSQESRSIHVRALLKNPSKKLLSGLFAAVHLQISAKRPVIVVPETAVTYDITGSYVFEVVDGKAVKVRVTSGEHRGNKIAVLKGIKADAKVVSVGQNRLRDDAPVTVKNAK